MLGEGEGGDDLDAVEGTAGRPCQAGLLAPLAERDEGPPLLGCWGDFLALLVNENLGPPAPVSYESIVSYWPGQSFEPSFGAVVREAATKDWQWVHDRVGWPGESGGPYADKYREGRPHNSWQGLSLLPTWLPGIFVGAILYPDRHRIAPADRSLGPDFALWLCIHHQAHAAYLDAFYGSEKYLTLRRRRRADAEIWDFVDHRFEASQPNPWHPLVIRKPLTEVFRGTMAFEDQVERFLAASREVIELLLAGGELAGLRDAMEQLRRADGWRPAGEVVDGEVVMDTP